MAVQYFLFMMHPHPTCKSMQNADGSVLEKDPPLKLNTILELLHKQIQPVRGAIKIKKF